MKLAALLRTLHKIIVHYQYMPDLAVRYHIYTIAEDLYNRTSWLINARESGLDVDHFWLMEYSREIHRLVVWLRRHGYQVKANIACLEYWASFFPNLLVLLKRVDIQ